MALPDPFFQAIALAAEIVLPPKGHYAVGMLFAARTRIRSQIKKGRCSGYSANGISGVVAAGSSL